MAYITGDEYFTCSSKLLFECRSPLLQLGSRNGGGGTSVSVYFGDYSQAISLASFKLLSRLNAQFSAIMRISARRRVVCLAGIASNLLLTLPARVDQYLDFVDYTCVHQSQPWSEHELNP